MIKKAIYILSLACSLFLISCQPTTEEGIKYNDDIVAEQEAVTKKVEYFNESMDTNDSTKINAAYVALNEQLDLSIKKIENMKNFGGKHDFKDLAIKCFTTIRKELMPVLKFTLEISKKPVDDYTDEDIDRMAELYNQSDSFMVRMQKIDEEFRAVQEKFAKEYKFTVK